MDAETQQTVLVVDDVPQNIDVLSGILRPFYKVQAATSGTRALGIASSDRQPELILLDIQMPDMDGYSVCQRLKENLATRRIPVIICSALGEVDDERRGFDAGCVDYITKPVSPAIVLARVRTHLALYNQQRELWRQVREQTAEIHETRLALIKCLGKASEYKDDQTGHHVLRMAHYSRLLALAVGFSEEDAELLFQAAPMHDVGKIGTPDHILKKKGKLEPEEWDIMRRHVENGVTILGDHKSELLQLARTVILSHHEKWDGTGYPKGLKGEEIPLPGRIVALADVFDALTSERPYKPAWSVDRSVAQIQADAGKHFDPNLVRKLLSMLPKLLAIRDSFQDSHAAA
ncbi:MAG: HD domain-containing protein [Nevskia sp.]|nr:HD domain-containing protein [Nevskia sp.]